MARFTRVTEPVRGVEIEGEPNPRLPVRGLR